MEWTLRLKGKKMGGIKLTDLNGRGPFVYKVNHMHMHASSEHRIGGRQHDLELHIVHELVKGPEGEELGDYKESLAVVAFLFKIAPYSHHFIKKLRPHDFGHIKEINFADLLPTPREASSNELLEKEEPGFYHYKGSLTSPPCADVVSWIVHTEVLPVKEAHLASLRAVWQKHLDGHDNYRDCQPLCGREVVKNLTHHHQH